MCLQIMILSVLPRHLGLSGANYAKNLLRAVILVQYIPRLFRILNLLNGRSPTGFIFESARANFIINLLMFMLASHVVGSCWYLFGLQRVNQCLRDACSKSNIKGCIEVIDCGHGRNQTYQSADQTSVMWSNNSDAIACLDPSLKSFHYGIYVTAVPLTFETNMVKKYVYSHFWGLQQISTLAGGLTPSYFVWEVVFAISIIGLGLLLFALLIGNIQNFLQGLGRRRLEMLLRSRDVEQWMRHRRLPENLRSLSDQVAQVAVEDSTLCDRSNLVVLVAATSLGHFVEHEKGICVGERNSAAGASSNDSEIVGPHRSKPDVASSGSNSELVAVLQEGDTVNSVVIDCCLIGSVVVVGRKLFADSEGTISSCNKLVILVSLNESATPWEELRGQLRVRQAERYNWAATRGVNEETLLVNLPEDLQIDIRRHLFNFIKKIRIFSLMDEPILDAICERLRQKTYINGSRIMSQGGVVEKMVFVVRGKLESLNGENGIGVSLAEGDACGEELLTWYLEHSSFSRGMNHLIGDPLQQPEFRLHGDIGRNVKSYLIKH
ncbi:hypothetical protein TSUD_295590 [Trifolium subterraneum]|uniref:Cyclic nucleotide-binding domain-containing protein n=1 Tax=Trifolium subterraneum TaxID=3900 RepID=A0A2Z6MSX5_TRISU|nr:hypothetical protein TSUD_295590 [Trifolium subterraneum]